MTFIYPVILTKTQDGIWKGEFPDLEGCYTCGENLAEALYMAEDVLAFTLYDYEKEHKAIPSPSAMKDVATSGDEFVNFIACNTLEYQKRNNNKAVKKTLSIPEWLNEAATAAGVNFSQVLQDALKRQLNLG